MTKIAAVLAGFLLVVAIQTRRGIKENGGRLK